MRGSGNFRARGDYKVSVQRRPRFVNERCTGCVACGDATRRVVADPFNYGLGEVKAAYLPHEHAFPMRYVIAPEAIAAGEGERLKAACAYGALDPDDQGEPSIPGSARWSG